MYEFLYSRQWLVSVHTLLCCESSSFMAMKGKECSSSGCLCLFVATTIQAPLLLPIGSDFASCFLEPYNGSFPFTSHVHPPPPPVFWLLTRGPVWTIVTPQHQGTSLGWDSFSVPLSSAAQAMIAAAPVRVREGKGFQINHQDPGTSRHFLV